MRRIRTPETADLARGSDAQDHDAGSARADDRGTLVITIHLRYRIDPEQIDVFTDYANRWMVLVERFGGQHHGYFLPSEGDSDEAFALFTFPSLADYERYRIDSLTDPECLAAYELARDSRCILRYERRFQRPLFPGGA